MGTVLWPVLWTGIKPTAVSWHDMHTRWLSTAAWKQQGHTFWNFANFSSKAGVGGAFALNLSSRLIRSAFQMSLYFFQLSVWRLRRLEALLMSWCTCTTAAMTCRPGQQDAFLFVSSPARSSSTYDMRLTVCKLGMSSSAAHSLLRYHVPDGGRHPTLFSGNPTLSSSLPTLSNVHPL